MKLNKEQQKIMDEIFTLLDISSKVMEWEITVPLGFTREKFYNNLHDTSHLEKEFIELLGFNRYGRDKRTTSCKILFGKRKSINRDKKEIILHYKYAHNLIIMLLSYLDTIAFTIKTREGTFSKGGPKYFNWKKK